MSAKPGCSSDLPLEKQTSVAGPRAGSMWPTNRNSLWTLALALSLSACAADLDTERDAPSANEPATAAQKAPVPSASEYDAPGPYEAIQVDNVGTGFETNAPDDTSICTALVPALSNGKATPEQLAAFSKFPPGMNRRLYTIFRPKTLEEGKKYPVITWGNGTCATPVGYDDLLLHLASHGFIVIGANSRQVGNGQVMLKALDYLKSENEKPNSPLFGKIDLNRVGVSGHSQGSMAAVTASTDRRIVTAVAIEGAGAASHQKPLFYIAGDKDTVVSASSVNQGYSGTRGPIVYGLAKGVDHITPIAEPALIWGPITAWFKAQLADDTAARAWFYSDCSFCKNPNWTVQRKNLK